MKELDYLKQIDKKLDRVLKTKKTWLTVKELSLHTAWSESKIRDMVSNKTIPFHKIDGSIRFSRRQIDIWMYTKNLEPTEDEVDRYKLYLE